MGKFSPPKAEKPPPPPRSAPAKPPTLPDETVQRAGEDERKRSRAARGFASTRLTSALQNLETGTATTARKELLGQ